MNEIRATLLILVSIVSATPSESTPPTVSLDSVVEVTVEVIGDWVIGLPLWTAVTVTVPAERAYGVSLGRRRLYPFAPPTYRFELIKDGEVAFTGSNLGSEFPNPSDRHGSQNFISLAPGEPARLVFPIEGHDHLPLGEYRLRLYLPPNSTGEALLGVAEANVTIRAPTPEEGRFIENLHRESWWFWFYRGRRDELRSLQLPPSLRHAIGFDLLLRRLLDSGDCDKVSCESSIRDLSAADVSLDGGEFFAPELAFLKFEIHFLQRSIEDAEAARRSTLEEYPELKWMFDGMRVGRYEGPLRIGRGVLQAEVSRRLPPEGSPQEGTQVMPPN